MGGAHIYAKDVLPYAAVSISGAKFYRQGFYTLAVATIQTHQLCFVGTYTDQRIWGK